MIDFLGPRCQLNSLLLSKAKMSLPVTTDGMIEKDIPQHVEATEGGSDLVSGYRPPDISTMTQGQIVDAYRAALTEHKMPWTTALRVYNKALFWSAVFCSVNATDGSWEGRG